MLKNVKITLFVFSFFVLFILSLGMFLFEPDSNSNFPDVTTIEETTFAENKLMKRTYMGELKQGIPEMERTTIVKIGAVGDVLLHGRVYNDAETADGYDFMPMLEPLKDHFLQFDFLMANQESIPGGEELGLSTYPLFNSPKQIVDDLQSVGFDLLSMANNHSLDAGLEGIFSALDHLNEVGMDYVGIYESPEDRAEHRIFTISDIDIGVLSYTYGLNGLLKPSGHEYAVAMLREQEMVTDIKMVKEKSDVLIVHAHWGNEYERLPSESQLRLAKTLVDAGTDIIIGHHPHVLQPIERLEAEDGREAVVFYSLGNFLSGQRFPYTDIGGVAELTIKKTVKGDQVEISLLEPSILPTYVYHENHQNLRVIPLEKAYGEGYTTKSYTTILDHTLKKLDE